MNDHSLWLIDNQNIFIFIQNVERNVFRQDIRNDLFRQNKGDLVILPHSRARLRCFAV